MNLVNAILAIADRALPARQGIYDYLVAAGGLYVRSGDRRIDALVPVAISTIPLPGLAMLEPYARLTVDKIPAAYLHSILRSARAAMPAEAMYQFVYAGALAKDPSGWGCARPPQQANSGRVTYLDTTAASVDLHSHHSMPPFFSGTDDSDEKGLRFYCVIGRIDTAQPLITARVGIYGHTLRVPATTIFAGLGPFTDAYGRCRECGCTEAQGCAGGCYWVEEDLCSRCAETESEK